MNMIHVFLPYIKIGVKMKQNTSFYRPRTESFPLNISYFFNIGIKKTPLYIRRCNSLEFTFLLSGSVEIRIFHEINVLKAGEIHIIAPGEDYTFRSMAPDTSYIHLAFSPELICSTYPHFFQKQFAEPLKAGTLQLPRVVRPSDPVYHKLHRELEKLSAAKEGDTAYSCELYAVAVSLCAALLPYCKGKEIDPTERSTTDIVQLCLNYIQTHYQEKITLQLLAQQTHLHPNYLCSQFKKATGITIFDHLNRYRINRASRILRSSDQPINLVAAQCGFQSASFFSRKFSEYYGMSPIAYKKLFKRPVPPEHKD